MCVVVCTGVLLMCMSLMRSNCSKCSGFVAMLHLLGLTCTLHCCSQCSMFSSSRLSLFLADVSLFFPVPNDLTSVIMSSANCVLIVSVYMGGGMSFTKIMKSVGPITDP